MFTNICSGGCVLNVCVMLFVAVGLTLCLDVMISFKFQLLI